MLLVSGELFPSPSLCFHPSAARASCKRGRGAGLHFPGWQLVLPQLGEALLESLLPRTSREAPAASCTAQGSRHPWGGFGAMSSPGPLPHHLLGPHSSSSILRARSSLGSFPSRCSAAPGDALTEGARSQPATAMWFWAAGTREALGGPRGRAQHLVPACRVRNLARGSGRAAQQEGGGDAAGVPQRPARGR